LYNAALSHGMLYLGTFLFGRMNDIWIETFSKKFLAARACAAGTGERMCVFSLHWTQGRCAQ
jgi:hypothetical protein